MTPYAPVGPHGTSYLLESQNTYKLRRYIWIVILSAGVIGTIDTDGNTKKNIGRKIL